MDEIVSAVTMLADLGGTVIVTAMLYVVWQRLNVVTDALLRLLEQMASDSDEDNGTSIEALRPK